MPSKISCTRSTAATAATRRRATAAASAAAKAARAAAGGAAVALHGLHVGIAASDGDDDEPVLATPPRAAANRPPRAAAHRPRAAAGMGWSGEDDRAAPVPRARAAPVLGTGAAMESSDEDAAAGVPPPIARVRGGGAGAGAQAQARKAEPPPRAAPAAKRPRSPGADARSAAGCPEGSGESQKGRRTLLRTLRQWRRTQRRNHAQQSPGHVCTECAACLMLT